MVSSGTNKHIPVAGPSITEKEIAYVSDAVSNCWYEHASDYHHRFEAAFAEHLGCKHAVALPSCTSALHLSLAALGVGAGDEVIVPDATWIASVAPVCYLGATPIFVDVDADSWCLEAQTVEPFITERTKAIIAVDLYGNMPDWAALLALSEKYNIPIVEDAAEAVGSKYNNNPAGSFGVTGCFSFHGSKTMTTGEGGLLATDDSALYDRIRILQDHGRHPGDVMFRNDEVGFKYKMSSMQAALGLAQLERLDELVQRKRQIFSWYEEAISSHNLTKELTLNHPPSHTYSSYWMINAHIHEHSKEAMIDALKSKGIDCRPFFYPLSDIPAFCDTPQAERARSSNHTAYKLSENGINLPSALSITQEQVEHVCATLSDILAEMV